MKNNHILVLIGIVCIALLLSACSSSAPVTPVVTTPAQQEQTPTQATTTPSQPESTTPAPAQSTTPSTTVTQPEPAPVTPTVVGVTATELAAHNSKTDCWVVYKDEVYDVTNFLPKHPGGVFAISRYCGTLGFEAAFTNRHGTSQVKTLKLNTVDEGAYLG